MNKKKEIAISRRSFLSDTSKTIFYGTLASSAVPVFLSGCSKDNCKILKEDENENHYCDDYYVCTDSRGFICPANGEFHCGDNIFSCYVEFTCTPSNNFLCQPSSAYSNNQGGAGS